MRFNNYFKANIHFLAVFVILIAVSSCGSSQYVSQDNDGIYGATEKENQNVTSEVNSGEQAYYKNYFKEKSQDYDMYEEDAVFTDIDSYEGNYVEEVDSSQTENRSYAGWGQDNDDVTINIYSGYSGFGFYSPWRFGNGWGYGWGYGGYDPFWCPPFYGGYYGYSYYSPYFYGGYGYGYLNPYYNYGYNGRYYGINGIAFNSGRRGSHYNRNANLIRQNGLSRSSIRTQRPLNTRSSIRNNTVITRPATTTRPTTTRPATTTRPTTRRPETTRPSTSRGRPANTSRTSTPRSRSSSINRSTTRSSSSTRSSSNSSAPRSSGTSSSPRRGRR
jgi:hypothetical protein